MAVFLKHLVSRSKCWPWDIRRKSLGWGEYRYILQSSSLALKPWIWIDKVRASSAATVSSPAIASAPLHNWIRSSQKEATSSRFILDTSAILKITPGCDTLGNRGVLVGEQAYLVLLTISAMMGSHFLGGNPASMLLFHVRLMIWTSGSDLAGDRNNHDQSYAWAAKTQKTGNVQGLCPTFKYSVSRLSFDETAEAQMIFKSSVPTTLLRTIVSQVVEVNPKLRLSSNRNPIVCLGDKTRVKQISFPAIRDMILR